MNYVFLAMLYLLIKRLMKEVLQKMRVQNGNNLLELSNKRPILLVFLRHFGCVFCKEALRDLFNIKSKLDKNDLSLVFVHMAENEIARNYFKQFDFDSVLHVSDPNKVYYKEFGLKKGNLNQLYGLKTWFRGFSKETSDFKLEIAKGLGDSTQMPGIFIIKQGMITDSYIHNFASDRPDYNKLLECCIVK